MILTGKRVLVLGGTGSMGRRFVERAEKGEFGTSRRIVVFSRDEAKQYDMQREHPGCDFLLGDVRRYEDVCEALRGIDIVVNAAALKQVPSCEYNPYQAVLTNCLGTQNLVHAIAQNPGQIEAVVSVSTDKACKPTTVMGMTKALQERITIAANLRWPSTRFVCVRYGNVMASRGSVIPLFHEQVRKRTDLTVTDTEMTRFMLTLDQAVDTMVAALEHAKPGEIFVPCAPSTTILNVAHAFSSKHGVGVRVTGIRPGEKLHEIMVSKEEAPYTLARGAYLAIMPMLPELAAGLPSHTDAGEYSSRQHVLSYNATEDLLARNGLLEAA